MSVNVTRQLSVSCDFFTCVDLVRSVSTPNQQNVVIHTWVASITRAIVLYTQPIIYILYYIYTYVGMSTHAYIYTHICVHVYIYIIYIYMYTHINLYIYTSVIYTYTIHITSMFSCGSLWVLPPETAPVGAWPVQTSVDFFCKILDGCSARQTLPTFSPRNEAFSWALSWLVVCNQQGCRKEWNIEESVFQVIYI